jgi:hypothetical protein
MNQQRQRRVMLWLISRLSAIGKQLQVTIEAVQVYLRDKGPIL